MISRLRTLLRPVITVLLLCMTEQIIAPVAAYALTGGPAQPEFSSFEPVATTDMVSEFTGAFTYNLPVVSIPGPNGSGYALSLSYHSGANPEEEASWVGYGWTLNPGAINRNKRGFPDDYHNALIKYWNKVDRNWTLTIGTRSALEVYSRDGSVALNTSVRYNNYKGFGYSHGLGINVKGIIDLGFSIADGEQRFSFNVNPAKLLYSLVSTGKSNDDDESARASKGAINRMIAKVDRVANSYLQYSFANSERATNVPAYTGSSYNFSLGAEFDPLFFPVGADVGLSGTYSTQENEPHEDIQAFGYMYSAKSGSNAIMDYYSEKEAPYSKRDAFLSIPFSNADNFAVTGEGMGGGFRLYNSNAGHFRPNPKQSRLMSYQIGGELHFGSAVGFGLDAGVGAHTLSVGAWSMPTNYAFADPDTKAEPEGCFFRFNNDPAGNVIFADDDDAVAAGINENNLTPAVPTTSITSMANSGKRVGRSTHIAYNTNSQMEERPCAGCLGQWHSYNPYRSYTKDNGARSFVDRSDDQITKGIGEFAITREDGSRYVYGLPVYSRREKSLQFGVKGLASSDLEHNYIAYQSSDPQTAAVVTGEEDNNAYAGTYLLTEITTPDYIDRTNNGPTPDDLGGYTKFNYIRTAGTAHKTNGSANDWYRWRIPYNGLLYKRNSLSDTRDDMGSVISGEKEIYYLESIETRTHKAIFVTNKTDVTIGNIHIAGSGNERLDGYEAHHDEELASGDKDLGKNNSGANRMRMLERIELYAKGADGNPERLLTTVRLEYGDYNNNCPTGARCSAWPGLPNSASGKGKLTLQRLWFEQEGVVSARVSPYVFGYEYKRSTDYDESLRTGAYASIVDYGDTWTSAQQTPDYSPFDIDRWGNYQSEGEARHAIFNPWVDQNPSAEFDPAAWQLKWIKLPSGGEIHVQYEQNAYSYVQDRNATVMVRLKKEPNVSDLIAKHDEADKWYYLDVDSDINIPTTPGPNHRNLLKDFLVKNLLGRHTQFKFLYALKGATPGLTDCKSEYISGYTRVSAVELDGTNFKVKLGEADIETRPQGIAQEFYRTSRSGILPDNPTCDPSQAGIPERTTDVVALIYTLLPVFGSSFISTADCSFIDIENSYIRIPIPPSFSKKGGGIRVKRLLMYDPGIESGDAALYGSEYSYTTVDGNCSGVASNEPAAGREENALITYLKKRDDQGFLERAIGGSDQEQFEGPIGESLLPAPSVGYSRVVVHNIHSGKTNPGFTIKEFVTARDFPFDKEYTTDAIHGSGVAMTTINEEDDMLDLTNGLAYFHQAKIYRTQGFRFILNGMHGQVSKISTYAGDISNPATWTLTSSVAYDYYKPGELVPVTRDGSTISNEFPGKEMEVVFETRKTSDVTVDGSVEYDLVYSFIGVPMASGFASMIASVEELSTHITTKVIRYPVLQKSRVEFRDGVYHRTDNTAFNPDNGQPVLAKTTDGYNALMVQFSPNHNGSYYNLSFPASWQYHMMGQKALTEGVALPLKQRNPDGTLPPDNATLEKRYFGGKHYLILHELEAGAGSGSLAMLSPGDLVHVFKASTQNILCLPSTINIGVFHVGNIAGSKVELLPTNNAYAATEPVYEGVTVQVIRSARSNQLNASVGSVTTYGGPPVFVGHP